MDKLELCCKACGYTWYPDKKKWLSNPNADEPDCPNEECTNYGKGMHSATFKIWSEGRTIKVG